MSLDWEQRYQTLDTPWDKGSPSPGLLEYLQAHPIMGDILVVGCGYGHDVRALAKLGGRVVGVDLAPSAIAQAKAIQSVSNETYQVADIFQLPEKLHSSFDWVWEHTCFCAISPAQRPDYVEAVATALKPSGKLLAIFLLDSPNLGDGPPHGVTVAELDRLFANQFTMLQEWQPTQSYAGFAGRERMRLLQKN